MRLLAIALLSLLSLAVLPSFVIGTRSAELQSWNATGCESGVGVATLFRDLDNTGACNNVTHYVDDGEGDPVSLQIYCRADSVQLLWFDGTYGCEGREPIINQTWHSGASPTACESVYGSFSIRVVCGTRLSGSTRTAGVSMLGVAAAALVALWGSFRL